MNSAFEWNISPRVFSENSGHIPRHTLLIPSAGVLRGYMFEVDKTAAGLDVVVEGSNDMPGTYMSAMLVDSPSVAS
jgi:hypothetical protein